MVERPAHQGGAFGRSSNAFQSEAQQQRVTRGDRVADREARCATDHGWQASTILAAVSVIAIGVVGSVGLVALHMARALVGAPYFVWLLRRARA